MLTLVCLLSLFHSVFVHGTAEEEKEQPKPASTSGGEAIPLIIDCDAGFDDSMAIVIAMHLHRLGKVRLKAVTIANGNTQEENPWNAVHVIVHEIFQQPNIPIYRMPPRKDEMVDFPYYGIDGHFGQVKRYLESYGGLTFPEPNQVNSQQYLCQQLQSEPNLVILVTGPLTNLQQCHHLIKDTQRIFMMGGSIDVPGNVPEAFEAEFNFATNPSAVRDVISHGNSVIVPLDCKMRFFTNRVRVALQEQKNEFLLEVFTKFLEQVYKAVNGKEVDEDCGEECVSIYDAVASYVTYLVLFDGPIKLAEKSVTIDDQGAVKPGPYPVKYCGQNSLDPFNVPMENLHKARTMGTDMLIEALKAAQKDFNKASAASSSGKAAADSQKRVLEEEEPIQPAPSHDPADVQNFVDFITKVSAASSSGKAPASPSKQEQDVTPTGVPQKQTLEEEEEQPIQPAAPQPPKSPKSAAALPSSHPDRVAEKILSSAEIYGKYVVIVWFFMLLLLFCRCRGKPKKTAELSSSLIDEEV